jgi:hypothetical protein
MPARYRKVMTSIWSDRKFRVLDDDAKLVFVHLLTHPHQTSLGAMRASPAGLAAELRWSPERYQDALNQCVSAGMVGLNTEACLVYVPNFLRHNPPESPNVVRSWATLVSELPECAELASIREHAGQICRAKGETFLKAFRETLGKASERLPKGLREDFAKGIGNPDPDPELKIDPDPKGSHADAEGEGHALNPDLAQPAGAAASPCGGDENANGIAFPLKSDGEWKAPPSLLAELKTAFPHADLDGEMRKARAWLVSNPSKRKTAHGMPRFLNSWLSRAGTNEKQQSETEREYESRLDFLDD